MPMSPAEWEPGEEGYSDGNNHNEADLDEAAMLSDTSENADRDPFDADIVQKRQASKTPGSDDVQVLGDEDEEVMAFLNAALGQEQPRQPPRAVEATRGDADIGESTDLDEYPYLASSSTASDGVALDEIVDDESRAVDESDVINLDSAERSAKRAR